LPAAAAAPRGIARAGDCGRARLGAAAGAAAAGAVDAEAVAALCGGRRSAGGCTLSIAMMLRSISECGRDATLASAPAGALRSPFPTAVCAPIAGGWLCDLGAGAPLPPLPAACSGCCAIRPGLVRPPPRVVASPPPPLVAVGEGTAGDATGEQETHSSSRQQTSDATPTSAAC
jgi:hypothetical protein